MVRYSIGRTLGPLLDPLFFVIFIGDLPEVVMTGNCVSLYADDFKTYRITFRISVRSRQFICMESTKPHGVYSEEM